MRVVFVRGACVRDGDWRWHRSAELLSQRGVTSLAPALPSCGETGPTGPAGRVVEIDAGHHPFLSRSAEVRDLVLDTGP